MLEHRPFIIHKQQQLCLCCIRTELFSISIMYVEMYVGSLRMYYFSMLVEYIIQNYHQRAEDIGLSLFIHNTICLNFVFR